MQLLNSTPRTQKALGVKLLAGRNFSHGLRTVFARDAWLVRCVEGLKMAVAHLGEVFARPCPMVPRHGFEESRRVSTEADMRQIVWDTFAADADGEILAMRPIDAVFSGIITPDVIALGAGHDGATGGHDSVTLPCATDAKSFARYFFQMTESDTRALLDAARISEKDAPYVEFVSTGQAVELVQMRAGPSGLVGSDYSPRQEPCQRVHDLPHGYDAAWFEKFAASHAEEAGFVVYQAGGNAISHAAVHSRLHRIHYRATKRPQIGDMLTPSNETPPRYDRYKRAMRLAVAELPSYGKHDLRAALAICHCAHLMQFDSDRQAMMLARALLAVLTHAVSCLFGEMRFWWSSGPGRLGVGEPFAGFEAVKHFGREQLFEAVFSDPFPWVQKLRKVAHRFRVKGWTSSFGGKKWARCATATAQLAIAIRNSATAKTPEACRTAILHATGKAHNLMNLAHNGGPFFNKHGLSTHDFTIAAKCPQLFLASYGAWQYAEPCKVEPAPLMTVRKLLRLDKVTSADNATLKLPPTERYLCMVCEPNMAIRQLHVGNPNCRVQTLEPSDFVESSHNLFPAAIAAFVDNLHLLKSRAGTNAMYTAVRFQIEPCCSHAIKACK